MGDDMMPNDGSYYQPTEPEAQVEERRASQSKAQAGAAMLRDLIADLEADIQQMSSIDAITVNPETDPDAFIKALFAVQQVKAYAEAKKQYMESLLPPSR